MHSGSEQTFESCVWMRQAFRVVRRPNGNVIIASDGLSDPFDDISLGGTGPDATKLGCTSCSGDTSRNARLQESVVVQCAARYCWLSQQRHIMLLVYLQHLQHQTRLMPGVICTGEGNVNGFGLEFFIETPADEVSETIHDIKQSWQFQLLYTVSQLAAGKFSFH